MTNASHSGSPALLEAVARIPVAALAFVVSASGLLFTIGFFQIVGLSYLPLFSLSEHLIFSLPASIIIGFCAIVALWFYDILLFVNSLLAVRVFELFDRTRRLHRPRLMSRYQYLAANLTSSSAAVVGELIFIYVVTLLIYFALDLDISVLIASTIVLLSILLYSVVRGTFSTSRINILFTAVIIYSLIVFVIGLHYGLLAIDRGSYSAILVDGTRHSLVRAGQSYFLVLGDDEQLLAVPAAHVVGLERLDSATEALVPMEGAARQPETLHEPSAASSVAGIRGSGSDD